MLVSMAWRNLSRNRRRTVLTGAAVAFGVVLIVWMRGLQDGSYDQMIDQAVQTGLGHLQVLPRGYLDRPEPSLFVPDGAEVAARLAEIDGVGALSARALAEGMVARDNESAPVELVGVDPESEARASVVPSRVMTGEAAVAWCQRELAEAREVLGGDGALFDRWCAAAGEGSFLPAGHERGVVLGAGLARQLLVSVGDEVTVQLARARASAEAERGALSQRRFEVTGLVRTGNPEVDDSRVYLRRELLEEMLGTDGPNEIVAILDDIRRLEDVRARARESLREHAALEVRTWAERNPGLKALIDVDSESGNLMYVILFLLVALGVVNATLMSVLERVKELGVMLALGTSRARVFALVMTEVALLGLIAVAVGALLGAGLEVFGRIHGWPLEWFGGGEMAGTTMSGVVYESTYYSGLRPANAATILVGVYLMFLLAGLLPAIRASRLAPVEAMRRK